MRKKTREPSAASLREMPELELSRYRIRKNPYAARIAREGVELVHEGPSAASLIEMPEADFSAVRVRRNPYASRAAESMAKVQYGRGRPRAGDEVGVTQVRSLRLPKAAWAALEIEAREKRTTVHALLRELVAAHLDEQEAKPARNRYVAGHLRVPENEAEVDDVMRVAAVATADWSSWEPARRLRGGARGRKKR